MSDYTVTIPEHQGLSNPDALLSQQLPSSQGGRYPIKKITILVRDYILTRNSREFSGGAESVSFLSLSGLL